jgi:PLD-like domain
MKTFETVEPNPEPGALVTSFRHPIQSFQWSDYTVSPDKAYTYRVIARTGTPTALADGPSVNLDVRTERVDLGKHAVFFNRGAIASQEYARRFFNMKPDEIGQPAFDWLSRGLVEGIEAFIAQAGAGDELRGAFFEFKNSRIYDALKAARKRGAKIKILYDGDTQRESNEEALEGKGLNAMVKARTRSGQFAHNKFLVLRRGGTSEEVLTGSTNLSQNGIFGHSNNVHIVRDPDIAEIYHQYWLTLDKDLTKGKTAKVNDVATPAPPQQPSSDEVVAVFSPRSTLDALDWYAKLAGDAERALFTTFAFGMSLRP